MLGQRSAGFFATLLRSSSYEGQAKAPIDLKERIFSEFFVILRGCTNFKTALGCQAEAEVRAQLLACATKPGFDSSLGAPEHGADFPMG